MTFGHFQLNFCLLLPLLPQSNYIFLALIITKQFPPTLFILYKTKHARLLVTSPIKICYNHKLPFFLFIGVLLHFEKVHKYNSWSRIISYFGISNESFYVSSEGPKTQTFIIKFYALHSKVQVQLGM